MVVRCDNQVPESDQLRSLARESDPGDRSELQSVQVAVRKTRSGCRYPGTVITVYIGTTVVYAGDSVDDAIERICVPGGIDFETWLV